jgi:hypothetical protein
MWSDVQKNIGKFQNLFGGEHMIVVDNDKEVDIEKVTTSTFKKISKWVKEPPKNVNAKKWIAAASKKHADDPGKYLHGKGKSHKGGEYKNPETDDHYSDFKG